ncbi:hypothetical protein CU097_007537 [Rhizopus azygosporus]|uniref:Uncharacterized protein n=1 Tax=Rhizopus azygosporus TaxID=86630 RepID=A0A367JCJ5_RHIAZ|nr:hypothetical protein CU097_007537 [Rhizopus azygosporus]
MRSIVQFFISDLYLSSTEEIIKTSRHSQEIPNPAARAEIMRLYATTIQLQGQLNKEHLSSSASTGALAANAQSLIDFS